MPDMFMNRHARKLNKACRATFIPDYDCTAKSVIQLVFGIMPLHSITVSPSAPSCDLIYNYRVHVIGKITREHKKRK